MFIAGTDCTVHGNVISSVGDEQAGDAAGIHLEYGAVRNTVTGNNISSSGKGAGQSGWLIYEESSGGAGSNVIERSPGLPTSCRCARSLAARPRCPNRVAREYRGS